VTKWKLLAYHRLGTPILQYAVLIFGPHVASIVLCSRLGTADACYRVQQRYGRNAQFFSLAFVPKCVRQPIASWHSIAHVSTPGRIPYVTEDLTWNLNFASIALWFSKSNPCIVFAGNKFYTSEQAQPLLGTTIQSVTFIKIKRNFPEVPQIRTTEKKLRLNFWQKKH